MIARESSSARESCSAAMVLARSCDVAWWKRGTTFLAASRSFLGVPSYPSSKKRFGRCLESPNPLMNFVFDVPKLDEIGFRPELRVLALVISSIASPH